MSRRYTLDQLAQLVGGELRGRSEKWITGVADVAEAGPGDATWITSEKYAAKLTESRTGVVLVPSSFGHTPMPAIVCTRIDRAVARLLAAFSPPETRPDLGVHGTAVVHPTVKLGEAVSVGAHVVIDRDVTIGPKTTLFSGVFVGQGSTLGQDCVIWPNVVIRDGCTIGNRVVVHPNAVIGSDGFGFFFDDGRFNRVPHIGGVLIEDDVEIGACTCIDRAKFGNTILGQGTKIDNMVQVAHNVRIGRHCVLAGRTGLSGSTRIGDYCIFGGGAGTADNVMLGERVKVAMGSGVTKDVPDGKTVSGFPAVDIRDDLRDKAHVHRLADFVGRIKELAARVERLEASMHNRP